MDGESIYDLIEAEGVTYSAAVPTVWQMLLTYMQENGKRFTTLERVTIGGSACPESIIRAFRDDYGVDVIQGWGMRSEEGRVGKEGVRTWRTGGVALTLKKKKRTITDETE